MAGIFGVLYGENLLSPFGWLHGFSKEGSFEKLTPMSGSVTKRESGLA